MRQPLLRLLFVVTMVIALAAGACGGDDDAGGGGSGAEAKFDKAILASVNNMMHVSEFVGVEKGFFAERGLDVELKILASGSDINKALQSGDAEFGGASNTAIAPARAAGIKSRLVAPAMNDATTATYAGPLGIVGRKDRGIRAGDPQSLKGKKVAMLEGSTTQAYLRLYLESKGMKESDVDAITLDVADHPVSLKQGDVDAAVSWEPYVAQEIRELGGNSAIVSRGDPVLGYTIGVGATESVIDAKPEVLKKFGEGIAKANWYIRKNPDEAAKAATSFIKGLNEQDARAALDGHLKFDPRMSRCTEQLFKDSSEDLKRLGEIDTVPPAKDMIDPSVMQAVEKEHPEWFSDLPPIPKRCRF